MIDLVYLVTPNVPGVILNFVNPFFFAGAFFYNSPTDTYLPFAYVTLLIHIGKLILYKEKTGIKPNRKQLKSTLIYLPWTVLIVHGLLIKDVVKSLDRLIPKRKRYSPFYDIKRSAEKIMECDQMKFIFQHSPSWRSAHFFHWCCSAWIPLVKKVINSRYDLIIWTFQPMNFSAHPRSAYISRVGGSFEK